MNMDDDNDTSRFLHDIIRGVAGYLPPGTEVAIVLYPSKGPRDAVMASTGDYDRLREVLDWISENEPAKHTVQEFDDA